MKKTLIAGLLALVTSTAYAGDVKPPRCTDVDLPMVLTTNGVGLVVEEATLCVDKDNPEPDVVILMVHGSAHDSKENTGDGINKQYSRVAHATTDGFGVLNITRIGSGGRSTTPADPNQVSVNLIDESLHKTVQAINNGTLLAANGEAVLPPVSTVVCQGQSLAMDYVNRLAGTHPGDCQAVVFGGALYNSVSPAPGMFLNEIFSGRHSYPAALDPSLDPSVPCPDPTPGPAMNCYTTTSPEVGADGIKGYEWFFLAPNNYTNNIVTLTEARKGYTSNSLVIFTAFGGPEGNVGLTIPDPTQHPFSHQINVPVIYFGGNKDRAVCGQPNTATDTCTASEVYNLTAPFYSNTTLDVVLIPDGAHDAHFSPSFGSSWDQVSSLLTTTYGLVP